MDTFFDADPKPDVRNHIDWTCRKKEKANHGCVVILLEQIVAQRCLIIRNSLVVCYIISKITAMIGKRVVKVDMYSLPNLLSGKRIVPELIQDDCNPVRICEEVKKIYTQENRDQMLEFARIHKELRTDSDARAAEAVMKVILQG